MSNEMFIFRKRRPIADIVTFFRAQHPGINIIISENKDLC